MIKRILCVLLCAGLLFSVGCAEKKNTPEKKETAPKQTVERTTAKKIQLLYSATDTLNPYTALTEVNRELCQLLYEPLISVDNTFEPVHRLAVSAKVKGKQCTVTLRDVSFTDGTSVTAADVIYSARLAEESKTHYADQFYEVSSYTATDDRTVVFRLKQRDPYFVNLLDFPIIKQGSEKRKNKDGVLKPPIGCGRYSVGKRADTLVRNNQYYGKKAAVARINLINAPDADSISHYVEIGATDIYFTDIADGKIVRMSGKRSEINLNQLVYLGYNSKNALMRSPEIRYAISSALDRSAICQSAYYNNALPAGGLFNPSFAATASVQNIKNTADLKISVENLAKVGYNKLNKRGLYESASGNTVALNLLVNAENESRVAAAKKIAEQLKTAGISVKLDKRPYKEYVKALKKGAFELYLGEVKILGNMDFSELIIPKGKAAFGKKTAGKKTAGKKSERSAKNSATETAAEILEGYYDGKYTVTDLATACLTELPVIPVCYRVGLLFYDTDVIQSEGASLGNLYRSKATGY